MRFHETRRLQLRQRLAHHGAAHAIGLHDGRLGRQFVARAQLLAADFLAQIVHQAMGQSTDPPARIRAEGRLFGRCG